MPGPRAVGDVEPGPARLDHGQRDGLATLGDGQVRGRPDLLRELPERGQRGIRHEGLRPPREVQDAGTEAQPAGRVTPYHAVRGQGRGEPVHDGAADPEVRGGLGDRQPARGVRDELEQP